MSLLSLTFKLLLRVRPSMVYERIKQQMMDSLPFVRLLGIRIDEIGPGTSAVSLPEDPKLNNHLGTQHAGALFTLAETASGAAKGGTRAIGRVPGDLAALKAELKEQGKVAFPVEVDIFDAAGTLAAQVQVDWYLSEKR